MSRRFLSLIAPLGCLLSIAVFSTAQSVDVLYAQQMKGQNTNILTYDVDPATLQAAQTGQPLVVPGGASTVQVVPSPDDHFVYILAAGVHTETRLAVYATDANGVPLSPPVQTIGLSQISQFIIDPKGRFAYVRQYSVNAEGQDAYAIRLFTIDAGTGKLTESPQAPLKFAPSSYCGPALLEFNLDGGRLNYEVGCDYPDNYSANYYYRDVDPATGKLGLATKIFAFNDNLGGTSFDGVFLGAISLNNIHNLDYQTSIRVYSLNGLPDPLINCTSSMLAACGGAGQAWPDISGQYLILNIYPNDEIVKVDLQKQQIVDVGPAFSSLQVPHFSLDNLMVYGFTGHAGTYSTVQIYGFDVNTGALTTGGQIDIPATVWNVFVAQRM